MTWATTFFLLGLWCAFTLAAAILVLVGFEGSRLFGFVDPDLIETETVGVWVETFKVTWADVVVGLSAWRYSFLETSNAIAGIRMITLWPLTGAAVLALARLAVTGLTIAVSKVRSRLAESN